MRISTGDFLRGLFLVVMMVDHLLIFGFKKLQFLMDYTYESLGFVAAAEGFIFVSGLFFGWVYGPKALRGRKEFFASTLSRILTLYKYHITVLLIIVSFFLIPSLNQMWNLTWEGKLALWKANPIEAFILGAAFLYQTSFVDILPLYIFLLAWSLLTMPMIKSGKIKTVLSVSFALWICGQFFPQKELGHQIGYLLGWFEFLSWQFLFTVGVVIGFLRRNGMLLVLNQLTRVQLVVLSIIALFFWELKHELFFESKDWIAALPAEPTNIRNLGFLRLINFAVLGLLVHGFSRRLKKGFSFGPFNLLGKKALQVFSCHLVVVYFLGFFSDAITQLKIETQVLLFVVSILTLYLPFVGSFLVTILGSNRKRINFYLRRKHAEKI